MVAITPTPLSPPRSSNPDVSLPRPTHYPTENEILKAVKESCAHWALYKGIQYHPIQATEFLQSQLSDSVYQECLETSFMDLPLKFESMLQKVNFLCLRSLLNFGSGFREELKQTTDRGAWDTIQRFCIGLHLDPIPLDAKRLVSLSVDEVASFMDVPLTQDVPTSIPGCTLAQRSALYPLVEKVAQVLHETGAILTQLRCPSLGQFVLDVVGQDRKASRLVAALVHTFPAFQDAYQLDGQDVLILKKSQFLALDLYMTMRRQAPMFDWIDVDQLSIPSDNVIPSVLFHLGILSDRAYQGAWTPETMVTYRAAAVWAVQQMSARNPNQPGAPVFLGSVLWAWAKVGSNRQAIPRATFKDTCMF